MVPCRQTLSVLWVNPKNYLFLRCGGNPALGGLVTTGRWFRLIEQPQGNPALGGLVTTGRWFRLIEQPQGNAALGGLVTTGRWFRLIEQPQGIAALVGLVTTGGWFRLDAQSGFNAGPGGHSFPRSGPKNRRFS